jgi:5-methylcytosine-specific restriction endonuclease McrA
MVDHIKEIKDGGELTTEENAQSLCAACHNAKTAESKNHRKAVGRNRLAGGRRLNWAKEG